MKASKFKKYKKMKDRRTSEIAGIPIVIDDFAVPFIMDGPTEKQFVYIFTGTIASTTIAYRIAAMTLKRIQRLERKLGL